MTAAVGTATIAPTYSGEHSTDCEGETNCERMQPNVAADDQRLEQMDFELALGDEDAEQDQRGQPSLGAEGDQDGQAAGDERTDERDEAADEPQHRQRQGQRHPSRNTTNPVTMPWMVAMTAVPRT